MRIAIPYGVRRLNGASMAPPPTMGDFMRRKKAHKNRERSELERL